MDRTDLAGQRAVTRYLVRAVELAHRSQLDAVPGYHRAYEALYPAYKYFFDGNVLRWLNRNHDILGNGHLIDAGANFGVISKALVRALAPGCGLLSIEPEPHCFRSLVSRLSQFDRVRCLPVALGSSNHRGALRVHPYHRGDHHLLSPNQTGNGHQALAVSVRTLDSLTDEQGLSLADVTFVKLDLQGSERHALEGMKGILANARSLTLCLEFAPSLLQRTGSDPAELFAFLKSFGYGTISRVTPTGQTRPVSDWRDLITLGSTDIVVTRSA